MLSNRRYRVAEYEAPVWLRSKHTNLLDPELNHACRAITGCLKPTNVEDLYLLAGIVPPDGDILMATQHVIWTRSGDHNTHAADVWNNGKQWFSDTIMMLESTQNNKRMLFVILYTYDKMW